MATLEPAPSSSEIAALLASLKTLDIGSRKGSDILGRALSRLGRWEDEGSGGALAKEWLNWLDSEAMQSLVGKPTLHARALRRMRTLARRLDQPPDLCRLEPERVTMTDMEETTDVSHVFSGTLQSGASTVVVAVKCLHVTDDVRRSFATEAIVWRHVSHPNVVPFIGVVFGWSDFPLALVSEWMSNATVRGYLQDHPEQQPQPFLLDVIRGLAHLHSLDLAHGDLKGTNVLIDAAGAARLVDFGQAYATFNTHGFTRSRFTAGTLPWAAPELLRDELPTVASDVYAFGCLVWELVTLEIPFGGSINKERILHGERPARPKGLADASYDALWATMTAAWHPDPRARPALATFEPHFRNPGCVML